MVTGYICTGIFIITKYIRVMVCSNKMIFFGSEVLKFSVGFGSLGQEEYGYNHKGDSET